MKIIDCHNHSLPAIDDGAIDASMAIEMLKIAQSNGTTDIILTPHHLNGAFQNFSDEIKQQTQKLIKLTKDHNIKVNLHMGSEVHLTPETADQLIQNKALTYNGLGKAALIELPKSSIPTGAENILSQLIYNDIVPIIAHPERNSQLRSDMSPLNEWIDIGCKVQLTGQSCIGDFGRGIQKISLEMIANEMAHLVASDAHRPTGRSPNLSTTAVFISNVFGQQACETLLYHNPLRLIEGEKLQSVQINEEEFSSKKFNGLMSQSKKKSRKNKQPWFKRLV